MLNTLRRYYTRYLIILSSAFTLTAGDERVLVRSLLAGVFVAFSPFVGFHSIMVVLLSWVFSLNLMLVGLVAYGVNNPWTMVPIYVLEYAVGYGLLHQLAGLSVDQINPTWMVRITGYLRRYIPIQRISLWAFLVGGHVVSILAMGISYIIIKRALQVRNRW